ncbi:MAG: hypothetical protein V5A88_03785 [Candidatus Thermoplasmatota archaeon]
MKIKAIIGAGLAVAAIVVLVFTFSTPWFNFSAEGTSENGTSVDTEMDFYLNEVEVTQNGETNTYDYEEEGLNEVGSTFRITELFIMIAVGGSVLGAIGAVLAGIGILDPKIGAGLVIIGIVFSLLAPLYLWLDLPGSFDEDMEWDKIGPHQGPLYFIGGGSVGDEYRTWGPSIGWFLALVAGILNIISFRLTNAARYSSSSQAVETPD